MADLIPIFDGHNDALLTLEEADRPDGVPRAFFERGTRNHLDLPRAREGGFAGGMFAIFVEDPASPPLKDKAIITPEGFRVPMEPPLDARFALRRTLALMAYLLRLEAASGGQVRVVHTADELDACLADGTLAIVMHFEGAEAIGADLDALHVFYAAGLRSLGPVWSRPNVFGAGVPFRYPSTPDIGGGLSDAGKALVQECNTLGVLVDLAHLNEKGFWDVARISSAPLVATHTAAAAITPTARNLTDRQLDAIGESGGVVGLTFFVTDLREDGRWERDMPLSQMVKHIDYIASRIGIEHVALGSDFDGASISAELGDVTGLPKLIDALRAAGYDDAALHLIAHANWQRVLRQTWREGGG